jgi:hypothetical protein
MSQYRKTIFEVTLRADELAALKAWIAEQPNLPSIEEAMAFAVCDWLIALGRLPPDAADQPLESLDHDVANGHRVGDGRGSAAPD